MVTIFPVHDVQVFVCSQSRFLVLKEFDKILTKHKPSHTTVQNWFVLHQEIKPHIFEYTNHFALYHGKSWANKYLRKRNK